MAKSAALRLADHRAIDALVQECRDLGDDYTRWHDRWLRGLAGLVGADMANGGEIVQRPGGQVIALGTVVCGWENGFNRTGFERIMTEVGANIGISPLIASYFQRPTVADGVGFTRTDILRDNDWYSTPFYARVQRTIGIDHSLLIFRPQSGSTGRLFGTALSREAGDRRDFTLRHRALIQQASAAIAPLLGGPLARFDEPAPSGLPPRVRQVLGCFLEGNSDKQVAGRLRISRYTVNQYAKTIFAHFGVTTRAELLARWVKRRWGHGGW